MAESSRTDNQVCVVGAGIVGICCALSLLEKGAAVRLIDRDEPGQGASYGNAGVISPGSCVPQSLPGIWRHVPGWLLDPEGPVSLRWRHAVRLLPWALKFLRAGRLDKVSVVADAMSALNRSSVDLYRQHLCGTGHEDLLRDSTYIHVYRRAADANLDSLPWQLRKAHGADLERIDGDTLREIEPSISRQYGAAILMKYQARALSPGRMGAVLAAKVQRLGGEVLRADVHGLVPREDGGWRLSTNRGELEADRVVVAAGAWSARLLEPLGIRVPLEGERGYHTVFTDPGVTLNHLVMEADAKFVASSMETGLRAAGTAEFADLDAAPNFRRAQIFKQLAKRMMPELNTAHVNEWMGVRPSLPDSLPCLGPIPGQSNLFAAFGHSHYGLSMAPRTGHLLADLVTGGRPNIDVSPYRIERFEGWHAPMGVPPNHKDEAMSSEQWS